MVRLRPTLRTMNLQTQQQLAVIRNKMKVVEEQYEATRNKPGAEEHVRELTLQSLKELINQLEEEIVRYESKIRAQNVF